MNNIRKKTEICLDPPVQTTATVVEKTQIVAPNTGFGASTFNAGLLVVFAVVFAIVLMLVSKKKKIILPVLAVVTLALSVAFAPINVVNAKIDGCKNVGYSEYDILVKMSYESYSIRYGDPLRGTVTTQTDNFSKEVVIPGTGDKQKDLENVIKIVKETTTDKGNKFSGTNIVIPEWDNPDQVYEIRETIKTHENSRP